MEGGSLLVKPEQMDGKRDDVGETIQISQSLSGMLERQATDGAEYLRCRGWRVKILKRAGWTAAEKSGDNDTAAKITESTGHSLTGSLFPSRSSPF